MVELESHIKLTLVVRPQSFGMVPRRFSGHRRVVATDRPAHKEKPDDKKLGKRKRGLSEENVALVTGMTEAVWGMSAAISEGNHSKVAPGIYEAVMGCPDFDLMQGPCIGLRADDAFRQGLVDKAASGES
jgi:hypothetical protein